MGDLDDLPTRASSHRIGSLAVEAFRTRIATDGHFLVQGADEHDFGTDFEIEALDSGNPSNMRVHVQVKGTEVEGATDTSVRVRVKRTSLNYLLMQADSLIVCFHVPTRRLLARFAEDVCREYAASGVRWQDQETITIRFAKLFDNAFQDRLRQRTLRSGRLARDTRLAWSVAPPDQLPALVRASHAPISVPTDSQRALELLRKLYDQAADDAISTNFDEFYASLLDSDDGLSLLYMAEINLGLNGYPFNRARVQTAIEHLRAQAKTMRMTPESALYCIGNGQRALGDKEASIESYTEALHHGGEPQNAGCAAQCWKNLGSALEDTGKHEEARAAYEKALALDPELAEAHFALGTWYHRHSGDASRALAHLDQVVPPVGSGVPIAAVDGWRAELLFHLGDYAAAFRQVFGLLSRAEQASWILPWCAHLVHEHGLRTVPTAQQAIRFWKAYLARRPADVLARYEQALCTWYLHEQGEATGANFDDFVRLVSDVVEVRPEERAFLSDRIGHWAQTDRDWSTAELWYRKAFQLEPEYAYCLGTSLNFLDRFEDALEVLTPRVERPEADALDWFQVAVAREHAGTYESCVAAYERAIELDPSYTKAWFNLGGIHWNKGSFHHARSIWQEAIRQFPEHELAERLRREVPDLIE